MRPARLHRVPETVRLQYVAGTTHKRLMDLQLRGAPRTESRGLCARITLYPLISLVFLAFTNLSCGWCLSTSCILFELDNWSILSEVIILLSSRHMKADIFFF